MCFRQHPNFECSALALWLLCAMDLIQLLQLTISLQPTSSLRAYKGENLRILKTWLGFFMTCSKFAAWLTG
jgi:hypothetical protein